MIDLFQNLFKDKKICLLGNGSSVYKYNINFNNYDEIVGFNQIYKTNFINNITILCHGCGRVDRSNMNTIFEKLKNNNKINHAFFCPTRSTSKNLIKNLTDRYNLHSKVIFTTKIIRNRKLYRLVKKKYPLTGIAMAYWITKCRPSVLDIYGFDFYQYGNLENIKYYSLRTKRFHSLNDNKEFLNRLKKENPIITHYE